MGESALDKVTRIAERDLMVKLGGLPPWLNKDKGGDSGGKSPAGVEGKKTDASKPHSFIPSKKDPAVCSVCHKAKGDKLHAKTPAAKKPGGNPFGNT